MLPKISIVTPSYNQGDFLEETINSVLSQGYPNLEYIIIDGGSKDNSINIIKKYEKYLTYWVSEKDNGQADAIRKGFNKSSGEILAWLNSDDLYTENTLNIIGEYYRDNPQVKLLYGDYFVMDFNGSLRLKKKIKFDYLMCLYAYLMIPQPSSFFTRDLYYNVGELDVNLDYCMDYDLFLKMGKISEKNIMHIPTPFSIFRLHNDSKSVASQENFTKEIRNVRERALGRKWKKTDDILARLYLAKAVGQFFIERKEIIIRKDTSKA
jgi:glycosyltransferase involved in cell wall biosynthesis